MSCSRLQSDVSSGEQEGADARHGARLTEKLLTKRGGGGEGRLCYEAGSGFHPVMKITDTELLRDLHPNSLNSEPLFSILLGT